jgi:hypothetical protein
VLSAAGTMFMTSSPATPSAPPTIADTSDGLGRRVKRIVVSRRETDIDDTTTRIPPLPMTALPPRREEALPAPSVSSHILTSDTSSPEPDIRQTPEPDAPTTPLPPLRATPLPAITRETHIPFERLQLSSHVPGTPLPDAPQITHVPFERLQVPTHVPATRQPGQHTPFPPPPATNVPFK